MNDCTNGLLICCGFASMFTTCGFTHATSYSGFLQQVLLNMVKSFGLVSQDDFSEERW